MRCLAIFLLLLLTTAPVLAQERARSESYPISVEPPIGWESFQGDPKVPGEVLFLQSPKDGSLDATVSISAFPPPHSWVDIVRRENFLMLVHDAPVLENQALTLRGAKGHKWVYHGLSSQGEPKLFYRLYLTLPATMGNRRLMVLQAIAPQSQSEEAVALFNELARSLAWGADSK